MPFITLPQLPVREIFPGIRARLWSTPIASLIHGLSSTRAPPSPHHHPHEQIISVLEGTLDIIVDGEAVVLGAGQVFVIPPDAPHHGRAHTTSAACSTRSPRLERTIGRWNRDSRDS